ncbi:MAG: hypothetical protein KKC19_02725 [Nanoarchaeota archaeon]|nr:hypothetical protein [Nanoarchaeota archaeon]
MDDECSGLEMLKKDYEKLKEKYGLPEFNVLNEEFNIEKIADSETETLLREIRKFIVDKIMNYMRFVENILNPVNAPMFIFSLIKLITPEDKKKLEGIYKNFMKKELVFIELDLDFSEERDANFIKDNFDFWNFTKKEILSVIKKVDSKWEDNVEVDSKGYFG